MRIFILEEDFAAPLIDALDAARHQAAEGHATRHRNALILRKDGAFILSRLR